MEALGFDLRQQAHLSVLTNEVVKSSAIEGENLNPEEVRSSIARKLGLDVPGLPTAGRETVHFEAPDADLLELEMTKFINWFNSPPPIDSVLKAGIAHLWFVTIHPFEDGNGRIARAIADMALSQADNTSERFYSMSSGIEAERRDYYLQLEAAQRGNLDITNWLMWFIACLDQTIEGADNSISSVLYKAKIWQQINPIPVNDRQRKVINRLLEDFEGHLSTSKYAKLAKCSTDTALRDIRELLERGIIEKNPGRGRSTSYRLAEPDKASD